MQFLTASIGKIHIMLILILKLIYRLVVSISKDNFNVLMKKILYELTLFG